MNGVQILFFVLELLFVIFLLLNLGGIMTWVERKESALIQDRIGANRASIVIESGPLRVLNPILRITQRLGLLHPLADAGKMLTKERFEPEDAHRLLYYAAPFLAVMPAFITFLVVPFGPDMYITPDNVFVRAFNLLPLIPDITSSAHIGLQVLRLDGGMLFVFAFAGLGVYSAALAGWSSGNKFALLGSIRASAQMISYEIAMGLSLIGLFMAFGTVQLNEIVEAQGTLIGGFIPKWGIVVQPLAFFLFFTASIAETKRAPFDLAEGESEIVAGYFLEYSGMNFGVFFMAEFIEIIVVSAIVTTLFFGGWQIPYLTDNGFQLPGMAMVYEMSEGLVTALRVSSFFAKVFFFAWFQLLIRWSLPRFRFDQVISLGWKIMFPMALLNLVVTAIVLVLVG